METGLLGKKLGMTQVYTDDGVAVPVTVLEVEPSVVIQRKTKEKDGYNALQLGYGRIKQKSVTKPLQGHFTKADKGFFRLLREIKSDEACEPGYEFKADMFQNGDFVDIIGTTKGKGFAGGVKRHGFGGGRATHGSMFHRAPGSIGASADPSRVFKGKKLPGHMGDERKTLQNVMVVAVRMEKNLLLVKGAVPGSKNGMVIIKKSKKKIG
jgi:large subunit ribosomal protein L3